jgi:hypothetical protein
MSKRKDKEAVVSLPKPKKPVSPDGHEPELRDRETILAYFEELFRLSTPVMLWVDRDSWVPIGLRVEAVRESSWDFSASLQRSLPGELSSKQILEVAFPLEGVRLLASLRFENREGYLKAAFSLPEAIRFGERRDRIRARFGPREKARVTVLEDFMQGCGATGRLVNLSLTGLCLRVDRVIAVHGEGQIPISPAVFTAGTRLAMVRIQDLPHVPMIECSGISSHSERSSIGTTVGLQFEGLGSLEQRLLADVLARRLPTFARNFPVRRRRSEAELVDPASIATQEAEAWDVPPNEEAMDANLPEAVSIPEDLPEVSKQERLLLIKKRGKRILIIMHDDLDRAIMAGTLHVDGFRQVVEARNYAEALSWFRTSSIDLVILDQQVGAHPGPKFLERLRALGHCVETPVVLVSEGLDVRATIMVKAMRIAYVQQKPVDYDGELRVALYRLLRIA